MVGGILLALFCLTGIASAQADTAKQQAAQPLSVLAVQFAEPLVATGPSSSTEDADLVSAILRYRHQSAFDDFGPYEDFLTAHPHSVWRLALLTNLGLSYYHYGYFSQALKAFERAWTVGRTVSQGPAKGLADRAGGELIRMQARLGHTDQVAALVEELRGRNLTGAATEFRDGAREGLWLMRNDPGEAYLCGPKALQSLLVARNAPAPALRVAESYRSPGRGTTLAEVGGLADKAGLPHRLIYRPVDAPVPVPAIVHWKVDHFAAIVAEQDGRYQLADPTFGEVLWVTRRAIDSEASGYFLVPGATRDPGWRTVSADEAAGIHGMGTTTGSTPGATTQCAPDAQSQSCGASTQSIPGGVTTGNGLSNSPTSSNTLTSNHAMAGYKFKEMLVSLNITDTPVGYIPSKGPPVRVMVVYNQREASQPATFSFFNVSQKWTLNWLAYIQDDPTMPLGASVLRVAAGGGYINYAGYSGTTGTFTPEVQDASVLSVVSTSPIAYQRTLSDGSIEQYGLSNGATTNPRLIFLTKVTDPYGNAVTLQYDALFRLASLTDATGRLTKFAYTSGVSNLLVTRITDPFGRSAQLSYDAMGRLSQITDVLGLTSTFGYDASSLVDSLTTPYGTTQFSYGMGPDGNSRFLQATDPLGHTERLEYVQGAPGIPSSDPVGPPIGIVQPFNQYINQRDTYYWDKHAYAAAAGDYTKARNRHWTHLNTNTSLTSDTVESIKFPLENRIWYSYEGQQGTPIGGGQSGTYDQPIDVGRVLDDRTSQLLQMQYNSMGNITSRTDPAGRTTTFAYYPNQIDVQTVQQATSTGPATIAQFTYNTQHLPLTYTDAAGQTTSYTYNAAGQHTRITDALGHQTNYKYDGRGDLTSIINADGKTALSYMYDAFDRVASATDSEGWTVQFTYDALDRVTQETFPDGTTRKFGYSNLDLVSVTDRQGRVTSYSYDAVRELTAITDPLKLLTRLGRFENGTLASITDPKGDTTNWDIDIESRRTSKQYANGNFIGYGYEATTSRLLSVSDPLNQIKQYSYTIDNRVSAVNYMNSVNPTHSVGFTYDPSFPLLTSMTDGSGTTSYQYQAVGSLGALQVSQEAPPAAIANATIVYSYDKLGRVVMRTMGGNPQKFIYDKIGRLTSHSDDLGTFARSYLGETDQITGQSNGTVGTTWSYASNANDRRLAAIANVTNGSSYSFTTTPEYDITGISDVLASTTTSYGYDAADRLLSAAPSTGAGYGYQYDGAGNTTLITRPSGSDIIVPNAVNQIASSNGIAFSYDANGNLLRDYARTYRWDAENRLISIGYISQPSMQTTFQYDGLGRRIAIGATSSGVTSATLYRWCGQTLCQAQSSTGGVAKRYFDEGEENLATVNSYYYGIDQLGSVRDVLYAGNGAKVAHIDYEPYGAQTGSPTTLTDFRYAGLFYEPQSGLYLANYREYDPLVGKWLSRDSIGESGGLNLYRYAGNDPSYFTDTLGLCPNEATQDAASPACTEAANEAGRVSIVSVTGTLIPIFGISISIGHFLNLQTGSSGYFFTFGGGGGLDFSVGPSTGFYRSVADLQGFNATVTNSDAVVAGSANFNSSGDFVGSTVGPGAGAGGAGLLSQTHLFGCILGGT